ncbi:hypothetical protein Lal_00042151 [Lupinus albus]|nr:hypothetical protein Lal_00042151 [Lupinus albus]
METEREGFEPSNGLLPMPRSRINGNFIDKTFSIVANILLRIIPTTSGEKEAFTYYRDVLSERLYLYLMELGQPYSTSTNRRPGEEALRLGINNTKENFVKLKYLSLRDRN